jgi:hypothetical protein
MVRLASLPSPSVTLEESVALIEGSVVGCDKAGGPSRARCNGGFNSADRQIDVDSG